MNPANCLLGQHCTCLNQKASEGRGGFIDVEKQFLHLSEHNLYQGISAANPSLFVRFQSLQIEKFGGFLVRNIYHR